MASEQLTATVTLGNGDNQDVTSSATWASDDEAIATVDAGLVTAVAVGTCTITATYSGLSDTSAVTVTNDPEALAVTPDPLTVALG